MWPLRPAVRATLVLVMLVWAVVEIVAEVSPHGVTVGDLPGVGMGTVAMGVVRPLARRRPSNRAGPDQGGRC